MSKAFVKDDDGDHQEDEGPSPEQLAAQGSPCITAAGFAKLQRELEQLWKVERPKVTSEVMWAAAQGDRSENAEYIYGKRRLREIDRRVRFLVKRLDSLEVVEPSPEQEGRVFFGAWVTIEDEDGKKLTYRLVGSDELDLKQRHISIESPLGRALLGRKKGESVLVRRPKGETLVTVVGIRYA